ncbi:MAG TPA: hypothetical protein PK156_11665, partial [Polyangium sp.]|nr:hypothetical protein [Polyangium sp.]
VWGAGRRRRPEAPNVQTGHLALERARLVSRSDSFFRADKSAAFGYDSIMSDSPRKNPVEDPFVAALRNASPGEPFTTDQLAELDSDMVRLAAGSLELVAHDDVPAWLEARVREDGTLAAE